LELKTPVVMVAPPQRRAKFWPSLPEKENSGTSSGGAQEKERQGETEFTTKISSKN
jgi:hypothetical protein